MVQILDSYRKGGPITGMVDHIKRNGGPNHRNGQSRRVGAGNLTRRVIRLNKKGDHEERYDLRSTILTSQVPVTKWHAQVGDPTLADSILDRLVHNAYRIDLTGGSIRKIKGRKPDGTRERTNHDAQLKTAHAWREKAGFRCGSAAEFRLNGRSFFAARLHSAAQPQRNKD